MNSQENLTQLTFHFVNGQTESFNVLRVPNAAVTEAEFHQEIRQLLEKPWWILHLPEQTVCIQTANVVKIEVRPPVPKIQGEGVFSDARRVTALTRSVMRS
ncbi:MAG: hypothetical protein JOZ78_14635 [Chroococcidiopsidaceae cyanobacterium CP_BM_ER_R8_30]|nr:hypothetical protein [Chroococcidiopsidaceae cyanobacterium CP_BM_ER_R8_30]